MAKQYQVKYLLWDEEWKPDLEYHEEVDVWMFDINDLDEAINMAKELIDIYAAADDYNDMFSLSDRHFGTYREDRLAKTADGIRAWVECM